MQIQFLYTSGCPYNDLARSALSEVLEEEGIRGYVEEISVPDEEEARRLRYPGSPTILVEGMDIISRAGAPGIGCRVYETAGGSLQGWPDKETIRWGIRRLEATAGCCG